MTMTSDVWIILSDGLVVQTAIFLTTIGVRVSSQAKPVEYAETMGTLAMSAWPALT